jgi:hypothetical protein
MFWCSVMVSMVTVCELRWSEWCNMKKQELEATVPEKFGSVLEYVGKFADPVIRDEVAGKNWDPVQGRWRS